MTQLVICMILLLTLVSANVEKLIFVGPPSATLPSGLDIPAISTLTPDHTTIRTQFHSKFNHTPAHPQAIQSETWFLLSSLVPSRRYEVRICWPATQPTAWELELFTEDEMVQSQDLLRSLQKDQKVLQQATSHVHTAKREESKLLLRVRAMADYFTADQVLMSDGLIVDVDIILDEYIWNLVPRSLTYTGLYLLGAAVVAVFIARKVLSYLDDVASSSLETEEAKDKKIS